MKKSITHSLYILILVYHSCIYSYFLSVSLIEKASKELSKSEMKKIKDYFIDTERKFRLNSDLMGMQMQLNDIKTAFARSQYDITIQGIRILGDNPRNILETSELRIALLSGFLDQPIPAHSLVKAIACIDWIFEYNSPLFNIPTESIAQKALFVINLAQELIKNHLKISEVYMLELVMQDLRSRLDTYYALVPENIQNQIKTCNYNLDALYKCRILNQKTNCDIYMKP